jgi:cytosine/adenosine deaminase-related metal-dependent hydrolase
VIRPAFRSAPAAFSFCQPDVILTGKRVALRGHGLLVDEKGSIRAILPEADCPQGAVPFVFAGETWVAAPILAHAHLESLDAPSLPWPRKPFSAWLAALLAWRSSSANETAHSDGLHDSKQSHLGVPKRLLQAGCARFATHIHWAPDEVEAWPWSHWQDLCVLPEFFAPTHKAPSLSSIEQLHARAERACLAGVSGFALHAPYSVSLPWAESLSTFCKQKGLLLSVHFGEHQEELDCLEGRENGLSQLFRERGLRACMGSSRSPLEWLHSCNAMRPGVLAAHTAALSASDLIRLEKAGVARVWCPGAHDYFERDTPDHFVQDGLPLPALGCDSMASNTRLDPLYEARMARQILPQPGPEAWWDALTLTGAKALGYAARYGSLLPGFQAEVLRIPCECGTTSAEICDALTARADLPVAFGRMTAHGLLT